MVLLVIIIMLTSCASPQATSAPQVTSAPAVTKAPVATSVPQPVTIKWWVPNWDEAVAKVLVAEFEAQNPNIKVEMSITTWNTMLGQIRTALEGQNAPDVITDLESRTAGYAKLGLIANLQPYFTASKVDMSDFVSSAIPQNSYKGDMFGMPMRHDGPGVLYNKTMFKAAGLDPNVFPKTWDELIPVLRKLTIDKNGNDSTSPNFDANNVVQYGMGWPLGNQGNAANRFILLNANFGGDRVTNEEETKCTLNTAAGKRALTYLYDTVVKYKVVPKSALESDNTGITNLMINKKVALEINNAYDIAPIQKGAPDIELGTSTLPGLGNGKIGLTIVNGFNLYVPANSKNKDAAWKLVEFIGRTENAGRLTTTQPARKSAYKLDRYKDPLWGPYTAQMDSGVSDQVYVQWPAMEKVIYTQMQQILLSGKDIDKALTDMCAEIDGILAQK